MIPREGPQITDDALDRLGRRWFAEVRAQNSEKPESTSKAEPVGEVDAGFLDWLFDAGDDATVGDSGGD